MASHIATLGGAFQLATVKQKATVDGVHIVTLVTSDEFAPWISGFDLSIVVSVSWLNCQAAWWVFLATRLRNGSSKSLKLALARLDPTKSAGWPSSPNLLQISMPKLCWSTWVHAQRTRIVCWWWIWYSILPGQKLSKKKSHLQSQRCGSPLGKSLLEIAPAHCPQNRAKVSSVVHLRVFHWEFPALPPSEPCSNIKHSHADKMLKQVSQNALSPVSEMLAFTVSYVCDMKNILRNILAKKTARKHRQKNKEPLAQTSSTNIFSYFLQN